MQNKPKLRKSQMNVNKVLTKDYEKKDTWRPGKNKPKTNPNKAKTNPNQTQIKPSVFYVNPFHYSVACDISHPSVYDAAGNLITDKDDPGTAGSARNPCDTYNTNMPLTCRNAGGNLSLNL